MGLVMCMILRISSIGIMVTEPLMLGLLLLVNSLWVAIIVGVTVRRLLGFFIFLVYVGGIIVVFSYVVRLVPNQLFSYPRFPMLGWLAVCFMRCVGRVRGFPQVSYVSYRVLRYGGGVIIYVFIGGLLLLVLLVVVSICFKEGLPLRATS